MSIDSARCSVCGGPLDEKHTHDGQLEMFTPSRRRQDQGRFARPKPRPCERCQGPGASALTGLCPGCESSLADATPPPPAPRHTLEVISDQGGVEVLHLRRPAR